MPVWEKLRQELVHAFAVEPTGSALAPEETALLEKIATLVVKRGMAVPAVLFLESVGPLNFLGSQVLHGLRPFLELVCNATEMERLATVLEQRESVSHLITLIQEQADSSA
ncbi:MAG: hypothetical protein ACRD2L_25635 [Terriglobia bacterium]